MWFNRLTTGRKYSGGQKVNFETPVPFSKCLRAKIYCNINVYFDPQCCQTLLLKQSEPLPFPLGSWANIETSTTIYNDGWVGLLMFVDITIVK